MTHFSYALIFCACMAACAAVCDLGSQTCEPCPAGTQKSKDSVMPCMACLPGYWQPDAGQEKCMQCPPGTQMLGAQTPPYVTPMECSACPTGKFSKIGDKCQTCSPGSWAATTGMSECDICDSGMAIVETDPNPSLSKTCKACGVGTAPARGAWLTPPGSTDDWQMSWNVTLSIHTRGGGFFCKECADKSWAANEGQETCSYCALGTSIVGYNGSGSYNKEVTQQCDTIQCPTGQVYDIYWAQCLELRDGHSPSTSQMGYYGANYGTIFANSTVCPEGTYSRPAISKCVECPVGKSVNAAKSGCTANTMPSCAAGEVPMNGLADQSCLLRIILNNNDAMYRGMDPCMWLFLTYSNLAQNVNKGNDTHPDWHYVPEQICPMTWYSSSLSTLLYRYCPKTMQTELAFACKGKEKHPVEHVALEDHRLTLMIYKDMWAFGFTSGPWGGISKNLDAGKYPYKDHKGMLKDMDELNEWYDSWNDCSDHPELVEHHCKSWYFIIACPTTCATKVFGTVEQPHYFKPGALTDMCDSHYDMPFYMGYVTPLNGFSANFPMLAGDLKDCAFDDVDSVWNFETGFQDAVCKPSTSPEPSPKPDGEALSDQFCAKIPVEDKIVCPKGSQSVCKVPCSEMKDYFQKYECCGESTKPAGDATCDQVKKLYKSEECCGAPAKLVSKPVWMP